MNVILDLNVYNQRMLNVAQQYIDNFRDDYEVDESAPVVRFDRPLEIYTGNYNRISYEYAMAYLRRHRPVNEPVNRPVNENRVTGGSKRRSRKQKSRSRKQKRRSRQ
jgi:hypothetical protein